MTIVSGLLNHQAGISALHPAASSSATSASGTASGSTAAISANDFLVLLVTEMKNQDPTASTDPNEYINQLVNVNSLQQLMSINNTLSGALGSGSSSASAAEQPVSASHSPARSASAPPSPVTPQNAVVSGNLSIPQASSRSGSISKALTS